MVNDPSAYIPGSVAWITQRFKPVYDDTNVTSNAVILTDPAGILLLDDQTGNLLATAAAQVTIIGNLVRFV